MSEPTPFPAAAHVAEIERRMQWRALPTIVFLGIIVALAVVAVLSLVAPRVMEGLPDDSDVRAARATAHDRLAIPTGPLCFYSALTGEVLPESDRALRNDPHAIDEVRALLQRAGSRVRDRRLEVALVHLDLARRAFETAARRYRALIDRGDHWPEAHLGLGVTLFQLAELESDPFRQRALQLESIAQFAAIRRESPGYPAALYDRALLLAAVGRTKEARAFAGEYLARDRTSPRATRLAETVGQPR